MIVLSSSSATRRKLLAQTGLHFKTAKPPVDETIIKDKLNGARRPLADIQAGFGTFA